MTDIQYLNYGNQQIEQQALMDSLSNDVQSYVDSQPWSNNRKQKFMKAYTTIMNNGITGANNSTGQWKINVNGTIDLDNMSKKDKEMYQEAAYFIQQQMSKLPTKSAEEEKKDLPVFNNFKENFGNFISKQYFGGQKFNIGGDKDNWNYLDERGKNGLRGTSKRSKLLAQYLTDYSNSLKEDTYDFKDSPFSNLNDLKTRIGNAVTALNDNVYDQKDIDSLNAIGLRAQDWFYNGSEDTFTTDDGKQYTYGDYYGKILPAQQKAEQEAKTKATQTKLAQQKANWYNNYRFFGDKMSGKPISNQSNVYEYLNGLAQKANLTPDEQSEIVWAFKLAGKNNALISLDRNELSKFGPMWKGRTQNLRKIRGVNGLYWDIINNRVVQPYNKNEGLQIDFQQIVNQNSPEYLAQQKLNTPRQLSEGFEYEDYARIGAALGDVISLGGFGANIAGSIISLLGDTSADIADDKVSTWEAVKNFGKNLGWTAAGFIPGGKLGKVAKNIMRWAPKMLVALNDYNLLNDESNKNTWNKLTNESRLLKEGLNDEDLKNITYWVRAFTGTANAIKATGRDIKYSKARGTTGQKFKTKDGTEVQLSDKAVAESSHTAIIPTGKKPNLSELQLQDKNTKLPKVHLNFLKMGENIFLIQEVKFKIRDYKVNLQYLELQNNKDIMIYYSKIEAQEVSEDGDLSGREELVLILAILIKEVLKIH